MSADREHDLSGRWSGIFNYPSLYPPNAFEATLRDHDGLISGVTTERDDDPAEAAGTLHAVIEGRRDGLEVRFSKIYDDVERVPFAILYSGTVDPGGDEIAGYWEIAGEWSGTFLMIRSRGESDAAAREASETVGSPA